MYKTRCLFDFSSMLLPLEASEFFCGIKNKTRKFCSPVFPSECPVLQKKKKKRKITKNSKYKQHTGKDSESETASTKAECHAAA